MNDIFALAQRKVIGDVDGWNKKAQLLCQALAQSFHTRQQLAALLGIDERHQADSYLEHKFVQLQHGVHRIGTDCRRARLTGAATAASMRSESSGAFSFLIL